MDTTRDSVTTVRGRTVDALVQEGEGIVVEAESTLQEIGVDCETDVVQGNPAPTIVEYADHYEYDLIAVPPHGREGISRYLLGSVTEKVVRLSPVPVLTARMQPDERLSFPYGNILLPTDGSPGATRAVNHGLSLATGLDATAHALSVVDGTSPGLDVRSTVASSAGEQAATDALDDLASEAEAYEPAEIVRHTEHRGPVEEILSRIEASDIDAVVMGTTGRRGTERILLGSVAEKTVRSAPVPVITGGESG